MCCKKVYVALFQICIYYIQWPTGVTTKTRPTTTQNKVAEGPTDITVEKTQPQQNIVNPRQNSQTHSKKQTHSKTNSTHSNMKQTHGKKKRNSGQNKLNWHTLKKNILKGGMGNKEMGNRESSKMETSFLQYITLHKSASLTTFLKQFYNVN